MAKNQQTDPYAPPPRHKDRSGGVVRFAIMAALLGAAAWGYMAYSGAEQQTAELAPPVEQAENQRLADGSYQATPQPTTTEAAPAPSTAPAPTAPSRSSPPAPVPVAPVPPPSTTITPVDPMSPAG